MLTLSVNSIGKLEIHGGKTTVNAHAHAVELVPTSMAVRSDHADTVALLNTACPCGARCSFFDRNLHSRMPWGSHACSLQAILHTCDQ
jgi:hypothetical protein